MTASATPTAEGSLGASALEREVEAILARALPAVDLREVVVLGRRSGTLRVVVDHPEGVDHGVCADVTQALEAGGLLERFGVEVWSPGPEPPLRTEAHFRAAVGQRVRLEVTDPAAPRGRRAHAGTLVRLEGRVLTIVGDDDNGGGGVAIDLSSVRRARIAEPSEPTGSTG